MYLISFRLHFTLVCLFVVLHLTRAEENSEEGEEDLQGQCSRIRGVNRSGTEYSCVKNTGIFEGPMDDNAIMAMKYWKVNTVRVPLNEDCWLGINDHRAEFSGEYYRTAIEDYVQRVRKHGMKVILELHWTDGLYKGESQGSCYNQTAFCQKPMPDKQYAPSFWKSVATQFKDDKGVIFDLFNEPFPNAAISDYDDAWKCWRDGGDACAGFQYEVAGMQDLVDAVRDTGACNLLMVGGLSFANDLSKWWEYKPEDKLNKIAASWHSYSFNYCNNMDCWEETIAPLAAKVPVIVGEIGEDDCDHTYIDVLMKWLDQRNIGYLGWTWNNWDCSSGPSLIQDYDGTPTPFGQGFKDHLYNTVI